MRESMIKQRLHGFYAEQPARAALHRQPDAVRKDGPEIVIAVDDGAPRVYHVAQAGLKRLAHAEAGAHHERH